MLWINLVCNCPLLLANPAHPCYGTGVVCLFEVWSQFDITEFGNHRAMVVWNVSNQKFMHGINIRVALYLHMDVNLICYKFVSLCWRDLGPWSRSSTGWLTVLWEWHMYISTKKVYDLQSIKFLCYCHQNIMNNLCPNFIDWLSNNSTANSFSKNRSIYYETIIAITTWSRSYLEEGSFMEWEIHKSISMSTACGSVIQ